jgi:uncharacterized membrane protein
MIKWIAAYVGTAAAFAAIDFVWLTNMTERFYKPVIGPILAPKPDMVAAVLFYVIYIGGIVFFAIAPALRDGGWTRAALNGAVLGFVAYATYDLTNQATLATWSVRLTVVDLAWGTTLTMLSATVGYFAAAFASGRPA